MNSYSKKEKKNFRPPSKWSELRRDLLEEITKRLDTRIDILRLRAVCKAWRSSIPFPPLNHHFWPLKLPLPLDPTETLIFKSTGRRLLIQNTIYCIEPLTKIYSSSKEKAANIWFVNIEEIEPGKVRLLHPFHRYPIENNSSLLPMNNSSLLPKMLNLLDYRVREVSKNYSLKFEFVPFSLMMKKVVVGQNNKEGEFVVMALHNVGFLQIWKRSEEKWAIIDKRFKGFFPQDIAYHKGRFYAVDGMGMIVEVNSSSLDLTVVASPSPIRSNRACGEKFTYLVSSFGDLFLIYKCTYVNGDWPDLVVLKLAEEQGKWFIVRSLPDRVMFVGYGCSFSVSATEFGGCKENCIYMADNCFLEDVSDYLGYVSKYPCGDVGLYDLVDNTAQPLRSVVGYSKIFWPPPTWL